MLVVDWQINLLFVCVQVGLSTAPVGISKRRRMAGPSAASRKDLLEMAGTDALLEQIIRQAQHILLRQRVAFVLDSMASNLKDPLISCHWGTISSPTRTSVKVSLRSGTVGDRIFDHCFSIGSLAYPGNAKHAMHTVWVGN